MIHHVVAFRFKPEVTSAQVATLGSELQTFAANLPGLAYYACGADLQLREGNDDFAVAAIFETEDALMSYLNHPGHLDIVARHVTGKVAEKHGAQFSLTRTGTDVLVVTPVGETK